MKTAISMDKKLLQEADATAMLQTLNEVYENGPDEAEERLLKGIKARFHPADEEPW